MKRFSARSFCLVAVFLVTSEMLAQGTVTPTSPPAGATVTPTSSAVTPTPTVSGAPTSTDQCKNGGWRNFTVPHRFKNEGDCVSWVASQARARGNPELTRTPKP